MPPGSEPGAPWTRPAPYNDFEKAKWDRSPRSGTAIAPIVCVVMDVPPGRRKNPSRASKRVALFVLAFAGLVVSTRLASHQLGLTAAPHDPFFGDGTRRVIDSAFSRSLPVPDALLGAFAYLAEVVLVAIGGRARWRTQPLIVIAYGALACLMALTSAVLTVLQPTLDHAWCTLCLVSAAISFAVLPGALSELVAAVRHFSRVASFGTVGEGDASR